MEQTSPSHHSHSHAHHSYHTFDSWIRSTCLQSQVRADPSDFLSHGPVFPPSDPRRPPLCPIQRLSMESHRPSSPPPPPVCIHATTSPDRIARWPSLHGYGRRSAQGRRRGGGGGSWRSGGRAAAMIDGRVGGDGWLRGARPASPVGVWGGRWIDRGGRVSVTLSRIGTITRCQRGGGGARGGEGHGLIDETGRCIRDRAFHCWLRRHGRPRGLDRWVGV